MVASAVEKRRPGRLLNSSAAMIPRFDRFGRGRRACHNRCKAAGRDRAVRPRISGGWQSRLRNAAAQIVPPVYHADHGTTYFAGRGRETPRRRHQIQSAGRGLPGDAGRGRCDGVAVGPRRRQSLRVVDPGPDAAGDERLHGLRNIAGRGDQYAGADVVGADVGGGSDAGFRCRREPVFDQAV